MAVSSAAQGEAWAMERGRTLSLGRRVDIVIEGRIATSCSHLEFGEISWDFDRKASRASVLRAAFLLDIRLLALLKTPK
jgi:hypothetical protein